MTRAEEIAQRLVTEAWGDRTTMRVDREDILQVAEQCAESYARDEREREVAAAAQWLIDQGFLLAGEKLRRHRPTPTIAARIRDGKSIKSL